MKPPFPIRISGVGLRLPQAKVDIHDRFQEEKLKAVHSFQSSKEAYDALHEISKLAVSGFRDRGDPLSLVVYSSLLQKQREAWSQSADIALRLGFPKAAFIDIYQGCNGFFEGVQVAIEKMSLQPQFKNALVASLEYFPGDLCDRFNCDYQAVYGDAAGAWALSKQSGAFEILSLETLYDSSINDMIYAERRPAVWYEPKISKKAFFETRMAPERISAVFDEMTIHVLQKCHEESGIKLGEASLALLPNYSFDLFEEIRRVVNYPVEKTSWEWGRDTGHVGCLDPVVNLQKAVESNQLKPGDHVFILCHGAGISVMGMMIRV